ncbi:cellulose synthase complex periplasmic endoglucanase BcsZ [Photobacterium sp. GSS17]|uniref:cellulose synthase complex periplasmic endoglucanase BcsZ n=1 Tax=Photobacterium sp. GSS17 TaxID=3020715 RepID=UPI002361ABAD|nr:cellulose synthase complex periplasmic endoglucanase BcsZ [Photobacterium sp. GSS17]
MRKWIAILTMMLSLQVLSSQVLASQELANSCDWPQWEHFKSVYMKQGRVIDGSDARLITTSEGQSYALFFALVANDKQAFSDVLDWTQTHLSGGDLTARLPAWLWGRKPDGQFGVLDANPASDSDLWIAYSLAEAGRIWDNYYYQSLAYLLSSRILREETITLDGIGTVLLPAPEGFAQGNGEFRINPSYQPLQLVARMHSLYPQPEWASLYQSSTAMLMKTMPAGFSPDWARLKGGQYSADAETGPVGSYNAIRTYLWAGMLDDSVEEKARLVKAMQPMVKATIELQAPPREVNTVEGTYSQSGSAGFSAAMLPLLAASGQQAVLVSQADRASAVFNHDRYDHYYDNVLALFGLGWHNERYRFGPKGELLPSWSNQCQ